MNPPGFIVGMLDADVTCLLLQPPSGYNQLWFQVSLGEFLTMNSSFTVTTHEEQPC